MKNNKEENYKIVRENNMSKEDEYKDISQNMRAYGSMRFAQLTLFFAITAILLNTFFTERITPLPDVLSILLKIGGLVVTVVFWVMEERSADYWHYYKRRAIELEKELKYKQYSQSPSENLISATNAVRVIFLFIGLFWSILILFPSLS